MKKTVSLLLAMIIALSLLSGCENQEAKLGAKAAINRILTCTLEDFKEYQKITNMIGVNEIENISADESSSTEGESLSSSGDNLGATQISEEVNEFLSKRFGNVMTEKCIAGIISDSSFNLISSFANKYHSGIVADDLSLTRREGEAEVWDFTAVLVATKDDNDVASVSGTLTMVISNGIWKADDITLSVSGIPIESSDTDKETSDSSSESSELSSESSASEPESSSSNPKKKPAQKESSASQKDNSQSGSESSASESESSSAESESSAPESQSSSSEPESSSSENAE